MQEDSSSDSASGPVSGDHRSDAKAEKEHNKHQGGDLSTTYIYFAKKPPVIERRLIPWFPKAGNQIFEASLVWILWIFGEDLQASGHKAPGYLLNCLAIICFFLVAFEFVFGIWPNRKSVLSMFCLCSILTALIYLGFIVRVILEPPPNIELQMRMAGSRRFPIAMTNDFLQFPFTNSPMVVTGDRVLGCIDVPVSHSDSNVVLEFLVKNDSRTILTHISAQLTFPTNIFVSAPGWSDSPLVLDPEFKTLVWDTGNFETASGDFDPAPAITIAWSKKPMSVFGISAKAQGVTAKSWEFALCPDVGNTNPDPFIFKGRHIPGAPSNVIDFTPPAR
jgi:hypothetical protein